MDVSSLPIRDFFAIYGNNISADIYNNFVSPLDQTRILLIVVYTVLFLIGACGNGWVACVITCVLVKSRTGESPRSVQVFILALCCCDLLVLSFLTLLIADLAYGRWVIESSWVCLLYLSSESLNKFCSPFLLSALSGLCYMSICQHSSRPNLCCSSYGAKFRAPLCIVIFCMVIMLILVTPVFIYGDVHYVIFENNSALWAIMPKCAFQPPENILKAFTVYTFVFGYIVPAALFTYFYSAVLLYVRRHARHCSVNSLHFWRVAKTTMGLVCFYLCCWSPYWGLNMYEYFRPINEIDAVPSDTTVILGYFIHMLPYVNAGGYPILYTLLNSGITQAYDNVKLGRTAKKRRRLMMGSTGQLGSPSRAATAGKTTSNAGRYTTTPSPTRSFISYLDALPTLKISESCKIRTSLTTEMMTLSPTAAGHRRSASNNEVTNYGSMI